MDIDNYFKEYIAILKNSNKDGDWDKFLQKHSLIREHTFRYFQQFIAPFFPNLQITFNNSVCNKKIKIESDTHSSVIIKLVSYIGNDIGPSQELKVLFTNKQKEAFRKLIAQSNVIVDVITDGNNTGFCYQTKNKEFKKIIVPNVQMAFTQP